MSADTFRYKSELNRGAMPVPILREFRHGLPSKLKVSLVSNCPPPALFNPSYGSARYYQSILRSVCDSNYLPARTIHNMARSHWESNSDVYGKSNLELDPHRQSNLYAPRKSYVGSYGKSKLDLDSYPQSNFDSAGKLDAAQGWGSPWLREWVGPLEHDYSLQKCNTGISTEWNLWNTIRLDCD